MHAELAKPASVPADRDSSPAAPAPMTSKLKIKAVPSAMPATVTVVIPCYNYARYLPAAVASALSQHAADVDVIVVDDRSTDDSLAVARELADADARVRVIAHESNAGPVQTFNDGLAAARGEFLVRLDADDMLTPGSLRRALAVMQHFPSVGLAYGHPILSGIAQVYVAVIRGTPIVVQVMFIYFALPLLANIRVDAEWAAIVTLIINSGAYISEIVRGSLLSVHKGLKEAGQAMGLPFHKILFHIIGPVAFRRMIPPLGNQCIISLKDSSLFIVIGVAELTRQGQLGWELVNVIIPAPMRPAMLVFKKEA